MTKGKGYSATRTAAGIAAAAVLVLSFTLPAKYIGEMSELMDIHIQQARDSVMRGDMNAAHSSMEAIHGEFLRRQRGLKLICHHDDIDEMRKCINCCRDLVKLEQSDNLICELNQLRQILEHMESVENSDIYELF